MPWVPLSLKDSQVSLRQQMAFPQPLRWSLHPSCLQPMFSSPSPKWSHNMWYGVAGLQEMGL